MGEDVPRDDCKGGFWCWSRGPRRVHEWRARRYGSRADWEGSHGTFLWGGVGLFPLLPCVWEESELFCRHLTSDAEGKGKDLMDAIPDDELFSALFV